MDGFYATHYDLVAITTHMYEYKIQRIMVEEVSGPTSLFANRWAHIKLLDELIHDITYEVARFNDHKSRPKA